MGTKIVRSALLLHVLCSLYPFRWLFRKDDDGSAASMILHNTSAAETSILLKHFAQDFGVIYGYLAYAAITSPSTYAVNRLCLAFSVLNVLLLVVTHNYFHPTPTIQEYDARFFREMLVWNGIGILVLILIPGPIQRKEFPARKMKWSIPANAIFCGAVFELFIAFAAVQWNAYRDSIASYMCIWMLVLRGVVLLRVRYFLNLSALRYLCVLECLYQVLLRRNLLSIVIRSDLAIPPVGPFAVFLRCSTALTYLLGIWWAGGAEAFGAILSSEKED